MKINKRLLFYFIVLSLLCAPTDAYSQFIDSDGVPRDTSFTVYQTYIKQKKHFPDIRIVDIQQPSNVSSHTDVIYKEIISSSQKRQLKLNIYRPADNVEYPAVIMIHGGGWSSGDLSLQIPLAIAIAQQGHVAIPIEYRLSPEAYYPAAIYDVKSAVKWVKENADKYGIIPSQIAVSGCSAGGQLANLCGATNKNTDYEDVNDRSSIFTSDIQAVINIDGTSDFTSEAVVTRARETKGTKKIPADVRWLGGTFDEMPDVWKEASPVFQVTENSVPISFINSSIPRFHYGRDEMIEKLSRYNIYTEVHTIDNTPHPFWLFHPWFSETVGYMTDFLNLVFKKNN